MTQAVLQCAGAKYSELRLLGPNRSPVTVAEDGTDIIRVELPGVIHLHSRNGMEAAILSADMWGYLWGMPLIRVVSGNRRTPLLSA